MADPVAPPQRRSPLAHRIPIEAAGGLLRMAERPFVPKFILRAVPDEAVERLRVALGLGLPFDPLTSSTADGSSFLWLGPDEWMFLPDPEAVATRLDETGAVLAGTHHQLVEVTDYYTVIELAGAPCRELLMKLTTLDLHSRVFRAGMVSGCVLGRTNATLWRRLADDDESRPVFQVFVRWSMADYLWCALADAGLEWGLPEQEPVGGETLTIAG